MSQTEREYKQGRRHGGALRGLEPPPRRGGFAPPSGNFGIFRRGELSVYTANVRVQSSSVAFTVQIRYLKDANLRD